MAVPQQRTTRGHSKSGVAGSSDSTSSSTSFPYNTVSRTAPRTEPIFTPTTAVTSPDNYGGLNPENENNLNLVNGVSIANFKRHPRLNGGTFGEQVASSSHDVNRSKQSEYISGAARGGLDSLGTQAAFFRQSTLL